MGLLNLIKKLVYTGGMNDLNTRHNMAMAFVNLMKLYKDRFQTIQDFRDQYMAMKKVCNILELRFGRWKNDTRAILKKTNVASPTDAQLKKALEKIEEELHAIVFMYKTDRQRYAKLQYKMENDVFQKIPFSKNRELHMQNHGRMEE